ncbi:MAG: hypothetical protein RLZZ398_539 [Verrucomicrobiota bacterium]|jgi:hypothetical protein
MKARKITDKQLRQLASWEKFLEVQLGTYPSTVAAIKLGMTTTGVYNAAERGHLTFFQIGRDRWYGRKDVIQYRWSVSRKFRDNRPQPASEPKKFLLGQGDDSGD